MSDELKRLAAQYGLEYREPTPGHVQVSGHGVLVNYWPTSKRRRAQVTGQQSVADCSPFDVIQMAMRASPAPVRPKAAKDIANQKNPPTDTKPVRSNPCGIQHFYTGDRAPWEFEHMVMSASDLLRIDAHELECQAGQLRQRADDMDDPKTYGATA